jgi:hypothetical protein
MKNSLRVLCLIFILAGCSKDDSASKTEMAGDWGVDSKEVTGSFFLFPLIINPEKVTLSSIELADNELVGVMSFGSEIRVYPYIFTFHNEIVNEHINGLKYAFSYCPLTKSAIAFRTQNNFRASGYLYRDNLIPWDEKTESIWSQMLMKGINGERLNQKFETLPVLETTWGTVKKYFPNAKTITNLGISTKNKNALFTSPPEDDSGGDVDAVNITGGEHVYGILTRSNAGHLFRYSDFSNSNRIDVTISGKNYLVYGDASKKVINAFLVENFDSYQTLENEFPFVLKHENGVKYTILGRGNNGTVLQKPTYAYVASWKSWSDFFTNLKFQKRK